MRIANVKVYGINESIIASALPKRADVNNSNDGSLLAVDDLKRAKILGSAESGSGHDCYLKGIIVQFDLTAPEHFFRQIDRYHFIDYISSQSKMHKINEVNLKELCSDRVSNKVIDMLEHMIDVYNKPVVLVDDISFISNEYGIKYNTQCSDYKKELFQMIIDNVPSGLELTARMTTNYLQLKSILKQRRNHKMETWQHFCNWIEELPLFKELTTMGVK